VSNAHHQTINKLINKSSITVINKSNVTDDYVHEGNVHSKFGKNPFTGDFWANS